MALVTGATSGIGLACAHAFGQAGARVVVSGETHEACTATAAALREAGIEALPIPCDVTQGEQLAALVAEAERAWGGIDALVCNAGVTLEEGPIASVSEAAYDRMMAINLRATMRLCNSVIPGMVQRGGGAVVIISSIAGVRGNRRLGVYGMTKAALAQLARNLAVEWGPDNVRVNAISPGVVQTAFTTALLQNEAALTRRLAQTPLRRIGCAEEIAAAAVFLASAAAGFVTGHNLIADGGTTISD